MKNCIWGWHSLIGIKQLLPTILISGVSYLFFWIVQTWIFFSRHNENIEFPFAVHISTITKGSKAVKASPSTLVQWVILRNGASASQPHKGIQKWGNFLQQNHIWHTALNIETVSELFICIFKNNIRQNYIENRANKRIFKNTAQIWQLIEEYDHWLQNVYYLLEI